MSRAAKLTFGASLGFALITIWGVHYQQERERDTMYQGVIRDAARRELKKEQKERELEYAAQLARREELTRLQPVSRDGVSSMIGTPAEGGR